jgi:hypothetical protein
MIETAHGAAKVAMRAAPRAQREEEQQ